MKNFFDEWWQENRPEGIPVDSYHVVKEACRAAWEKGQEEENFRCGLIAETYVFSPNIGRSIAAQIYRKKDD